MEEEGNKVKELKRGSREGKGIKRSTRDSIVYQLACFYSSSGK